MASDCDANTVQLTDANQIAVHVQVFIDCRGEGDCRKGHSVDIIELSSCIKVLPEGHCCGEKGTDAGAHVGFK